MSIETAGISRREKLFFPRIVDNVLTGIPLGLVAAFLGCLVIYTSVLGGDVQGKTHR